MQTSPQLKKRNFAISYIKGIAILFIMLIHLIDWGDMVVSPTGRLWKQILYTGVVFFMATAGSVVWIAYGKSDDLKRSSKRLIKRGLELIAIYYSYNIIKFALFDFSKEKFYGGFMQQGIFNWHGILTLRSYAVPIPILFTIGFLLLFSPLFLYILKKSKRGVWYLVALLALLCTINYIVPLPQNAFTNFLYARGNITFSILPWFTAFLTGLLVAYAGFDRQKKLFLPLFFVLTLLTLWFAKIKGWSWYLDSSLHPLQPQAIALSFTLMFLLIYLFAWIEKKYQQKGVHTALAVVRVLGDCTLWLYVAHWIVIDSTLWLFSSRSFVIWFAMIPLFVFFFWWKRKMIAEYRDQF